MRIATGMSLPANGTGFCMGTVHKMTSHLCKLRNQVDDICLQVSSDSNTKGPSLSVEDKSYSANAFLPSVNVLAFLLFLVASSYFLLRKSVDTFGSCREKHAEKVSSSDSTVSNASIKNDATAAYDNLSISESSGCSHRIFHMNSYKCDAYFEISDLEKACYMNSLLSLEDDDDSEWLSDLMPCGSSSEEPSTPLSYKSDAYYEISDFEQGCYIHSLLNLDDEDSEWLSDSKSFERSSEEPSTPLSYKSDSYYAILDFDKESYLHSLLSLEDEESEWLSDSKSFGCSSDNPSTPFSCKIDLASEISDLDKESYTHSLINLEDEDSEWFSNSKSFEYSFENPSTPLRYEGQISHLDKAGYFHSLLSLEDDDDDDSEWLSDSKPYACSPENLSTPLSYRTDAFSEISHLDKANYMHSLLNLEGEESEWLSDSKSFGCSSSENPSTPFSYKFDDVSDISDLDKEYCMHSLLILEDENSDRLLDCKSYYECSSENSTPLSSKCDSYYDVSDLDKASYLHSLLILEDEDSEWLSDSTSWDIVVPPSVSTCSNFGDSEDKNLLETAGLEENFSADEPLFWPLEGKVNWNSEETWSSFCTSPRRRFALNSGVCSVNKKEYFALGEVPIETLVGLKEFDGHEALLLDSEFNDVFVVDE
ncbi:hypothetical protein ACSQ67_011015 [Phaseolus vulgaris]